MSGSDQPSFFPTHAPRVISHSWYDNVLYQIVVVVIVSIILVITIIYFYSMRKIKDAESEELKRLSTTVVINIDDDDIQEDSPLLSDVQSEKFDSYRSKTVLKSTKLNNNSYFNIEDLNGGALHDMQLKSRFHSIMATGVIVNLHTSKGPRPIILTLIYDEIRWQAVTNAKKKYKLSLYDIINIESGKKTENFLKDKTLDESKCFSIITSKTSIDIEVNCLLDRDCFVKAMRNKLIEVRELKK